MPVAAANSINNKMLDQHCFELCGTRDHKGSILESYKAVYPRSTMVLFSRKTRSPLAALTLKAHDVGCLSMLTGRPAPGGASAPYFQGMLNMPDQAFTFTITNLSNEGMINFNVLHTPHRVSEVDPGPAYGINEVNELRTNQSYTIQADQRNNRKMILRAKTKIVKDYKTAEKKEVPLTVEDSEATEKPTGLYFYLSVAPDESCMELVNKFAEGTVWKATQGFVRRVAKQLLPGFVRPERAPDQYEFDYLFKIILVGDYKVGKSSLSSRFTRDEFNLETASTFGVDFFTRTVQIEGKTIKLQIWDTGGQERFRTIVPAYYRSADGAIVVFDITNADSFNNVKQWLCRLDRYAPKNVNKLLVGSKCDLGHLREVKTEQAMAFAEQHNLDFVETSALDGTDVATAFQRIAADIYRRVMRELHEYRGPPSIRLGAALSPPPLSTSLITRIRALIPGAPSGVREMPAGVRRAVPFQARTPASASRESQPLPPLSKIGTKLAEPVDVGSTQATELNYGNQVAVHSSYTGHNYAFEHCSEPTVLCMSIWEDMKFLGLANIEEELAEEVEEWLKNEGKALIESLNAIFKTGTCVIDLESEADTIVCTCGHQCIHHANVEGTLRRCPMCRSPITAFVRADGIVVE